MRFIRSLARGQTGNSGLPLSSSPPTVTKVGERLCQPVYPVVCQQRGAQSTVRTARWTHTLDAWQAAQHDGSAAWFHACPGFRSHRVIVCVTECTPFQILISCLFSSRCHLLSSLWDRHRCDQSPWCMSSLRFCVWTMTTLGTFQFSSITQSRFFVSFELQ